MLCSSHALLLHVIKWCTDCSSHGNFFEPRGLPAGRSLPLWNEPMVIYNGACVSRPNCRGAQQGQPLACATYNQTWPQSHGTHPKDQPQSQPSSTTRVIVDLQRFSLLVWGLHPALHFSTVHSFKEETQTESTATAQW